MTQESVDGAVALFLALFSSLVSRVGALACRAA